MNEITFLIPVYNDWKSLKVLLEKIELQIKKLNYEFEVVILNDFSTIDHDISLKNLEKLKKIKVINLKKNVGSQRAIAIGLKFISEIYENKDNRVVIIMDSDGQDDPEIIEKIIKINENHPEKIITINRSKRSEPLWFKVLYEIHYYTLILFTGRKIRYGNYSLISLKKIKNLLLTGNLWAAYSAAISKSHKNTYKFFHERKPRYSGNAKMNFYKLFNHSLRIFSVFKYQILTSSIIYSSIFFFFGSIFYFILPLVIAGNILIFSVSSSDKKKFDMASKTIIENVETLK